MKASRMMKRGCALALAAALAVPCLNFMQARAAAGIDVEKEDCSITVSIGAGAPGTDATQYLDDFSRMAIPVSVYKVADVDVTGQRYTASGAFAGMKFDALSPDRDAAAAVWEGLALEAKEILDQTGSLTADGSTEVTASASGVQGTIPGLTTGLYLVVPQQTYNPSYTVLYTFTPYLTALPSSEYTLSGSGSDEWDYDTVIGLKPAAEPQFGRLRITKILQNYNETLGPTTFVFRIVGKDTEGIVRYEEVASMTYTAAGSSTITLEHIPAGLLLTVTEVYSGASYEAVGATEGTALVWSEQAILDGAEGAQEASVTFENRYGGGNRGGYGVTNHFESDGTGGWIWENPTTPPEA